MAKHDVLVVVKARDDASRKFTRIGGSALGMGSMLKKAAGMAVAYFGARSVIRMIQYGAAFEQTMSRVGAKANATGAQLEQLTKEAERLGSATAFTATQAGEGMEFLALAGFEVNQIIAAMPATLNLAAAGQLELAQAADITAGIMKGMGHGVEDLENDVDILAKAFTSANTNLVQVGEGMVYVGPIARSVEMDIGKITAAIQLLSDAKIQGSMAGTSLRQIIAALTGGIPTAASGLKKLGVVTIDVEGKLLPLADIIDKLNASMADLGSAERTAKVLQMFGKRAGPGMAAMLLEGGAALRAYERQLEDAAGTAQRIADQQLDNVAGSYTKLKSVVTGVWLAIQEKFKGSLQDTLDAMREWVVDHKAAILEWANAFIEGVWDVKDGLLSFVEYMQKDWISATKWAMSSFLDVLEATFNSAVTLAIAGGRGIWKGVKKGVMGEGATGEGAIMQRTEKLWREADEKQIDKWTASGLPVYGQVRKLAEAELLREEAEKLTGHIGEIVKLQWMDTLEEIWSKAPAGFLEGFEERQQERIDRARIRSERRFGRGMLAGLGTAGGAGVAGGGQDVVSQIATGAARGGLAALESRFMTFKPGQTFDPQQQTAKNTKDMASYLKDADKMLKGIETGINELVFETRVLPAHAAELPQTRFT